MSNHAVKLFESVRETVSELDTSVLVIFEKIREFELVGFLLFFLLGLVLISF